MGNELTRREFSKVILGSVGALWSAMTLYPVFRYLDSGAKAQVDEGSQISSLSLGSYDDFLLGSSKNFKFGNIPALLIKSEDGSLHAYNATCTHLGCTVQFSSEKKKIFCACHGGQFDPSTGKNLSGPPPKPLAMLKAELIDGEIIISKLEAKNNVA